MPARLAAVLLLIYGGIVAIPPAAMAQSMIDCKLIGSAPPSLNRAGYAYSTVIEDGFLRLVLVRPPAGPSYAVDYTPYRNGMSIRVSVRAGRIGEASEALSTIATVRPDQSTVTFDKWDVASDRSTLGTKQITLSCDNAVAGRSATQR